MPPRYAVLDSDSEDKPSTPSVAKMEKALRDAVAEVFRSGKMEELTVKRVRMAAEQALGLTEGFFKGDTEWKGESDRIIKDEVETQDRATQGDHEDEEYHEENHENSPPPPPAEATKPAKQTKPAKAAKRENEDDSSKARKRRKTSSPEREESAQPEEESEEEVKKPAKRQSKAKPEKKQQRKRSEDRVPDESESEEVKKPEKPKAKPKAKEPVSDDSDPAEDEPKPSEEANVNKDGSESEMSEVIDDEPPKPKPKQQKNAEAQPGKAKKGAKGKDADLDPDLAEIKRLQGWLIKCGVRKIWARELAPYDTPKAKIKHLREMLKDAGMTGRYSLEKAKRIQEERELKADLEMVQEGAKLWGRGNEDEGSEGERPRRRLARGRKSLAFLDNEGEEESE